VGSLRSEAWIAKGESREMGGLRGRRLYTDDDEAHAALPADDRYSKMIIVIGSHTSRITSHKSQIWRERKTKTRQDEQYQIPNLLYYHWRLAAALLERGRERHIETNERRYDFLVSSPFAFLFLHLARIRICGPSCYICAVEELGFELSICL
jgi:hypothetical protein